MKCCVAFAQCNTAVTRPSLKNSQKEAKQCCPPSTSKPSNADFYPKCKFCPIQFLPQNDMDIGHQLAASIWCLYKIIRARGITKNRHLQNTFFVFYQIMRNIGSEEFHFAQCYRAQYKVTYEVQITLTLVMRTSESSCNVWFPCQHLCLSSLMFFLLCQAFVAQQVHENTNTNTLLKFNIFTF